MLKITMEGNSLAMALRWKSPATDTILSVLTDSAAKIVIKSCVCIHRLPKVVAEIFERSQGNSSEKV